MTTTQFGITMDEEVYDEIEKLRGREKRSTFITMLVKLGLIEYYKRHSQKIDVIKEA
jgi:metal-responsive CopG/Arc/MetJ family transcriptional regulator